MWDRLATKSQTTRSNVAPAWLQTLLFLIALIDHVLSGSTLASPQLLSHRLNVCERCRLMNPERRVCNACGCHVDLKATWETETCPKGFWEGKKEATSSGGCGCGR